MYSTYEEIRGMIKEDAISTLIGTEYIEGEFEREIKFKPIVQDAISDADGEIDGYLAKKHSVPLNPVPKIINKLSKDIAVYNLFSRIGIDDERDKNYLERYKAAIKFLENIAKGIVTIGTENIENAASGSFSVNSNQRLFSRNTMQGM